MPIPTQPIADLPTPDADALAHSDRLRAHIVAEIDEAGGAITFERYMELALYAPGLGYYSAGAQKFGAAGDFITAPEVSPLFSRIVARQWIEILTAIGGDTVLELGAGSGALAAAALTEMAERDALPAHYRILETSAELRARQQARLEQALPAEVLARVTWLDALPETPFRGVIFGNEVLDALPVARFQVTDDGLCEQGVAHNGGELVGWPLAPRAALREAVTTLEAERGAPFPPGYASEINLNLSPFVRGLAECLDRGAMLLIDYGLPRSAFYLAERAAGTLMCHYRHRAHGDPFLYPGLQDITAYVDFTAVAEAGVAAGLDVDGYTTQAFFLLAGGLEDELRESDAEATRAHLELTQQVKMLTSPADMGERFKAILVGRGLDEPPSAFALRDLTHQL
ncbi:MAG TPA: SAM-dependent methyltransferase [Gammaproteobacteria bacterium]|nr:SAM-dependent methyltransferase [Gammaproteobacteria bacterium]